MANYNGHRQRVRVGTDEMGQPVVKWACGQTIDALNDSIVGLYAENGLISKFLGASSGRVVESGIEESDGILFKDYTSEWMSRYKELTIEKNTMNGYKSYLSKHLLPAFGDMNLLEISIDDIQDFMNDREEYAKSTIDKMLQLLKQIFDSAVEDGKMPLNPAKSRRLKNPSDKVTVREALPLDVILDIIAQIIDLEEQDRRLMALLMFTDMRRGEALGLKWEDINYEKMLISVQRSVAFPSNQPLVKSPKTKNGYRQIPLDSELITMLAAPDGAKGYIIGGNNPISLTSYRNTYARIEKRVNLHDATAHIFRHSYITLLDEAGVGHKTIQVIAGHGDIRTTGRYIHGRMKEVQSAGEKFAALVSENERFQALVGKSEKYRSLLAPIEGKMRS